MAISIWRKKPSYTVGHTENCEKVKKPWRPNDQFGLGEKQMWRPKWPFDLCAFSKKNKNKSCWFGKFDLINYGI